MQELTTKQIYESYLPGSLGFHELVHTMCLVAELFHKEVVEHPAAKHLKLRSLVEQTNSDLFTLYNEVASLSCERTVDNQ